MTGMTGPSRRWSGGWADTSVSDVPALDVLIPTMNRPAELAVTLAGLAAQDDPAFSVVIGDQSDAEVAGIPAVASMLRLLRSQGRRVSVHRHLPRRGLAEHRQFLLDNATAEFVLFLDDDVWLEPGTLERMVEAIGVLGCGFVGCFPQALSYVGDDRPHERAVFEPWHGTTRPEQLRTNHPALSRQSLHNAANLTHLAAEVPVPRGGWIAYKVAWLGACVLYRRHALVECGGFDFWERLPEVHAGEDVAAEWRVMERFGGAGLLPSGAVHLESPTTLPDRPVEAPDVVFSSRAD